MSTIIPEKPTTVTCKPWCDDQPLTEDAAIGHVCSGWLTCMEGATVIAVDKPDGEPVLILRGNSAVGEIKIASEVEISLGTAESKAALLAAAGLNDLASLVRDALKLVKPSTPLIPEEATDTPRRHLLTLAHRALGFPNMSVEDEVAMVSTLGDRKERGIVFDALCNAVAARDPQKAERQLATLTAVAR